MDVGSGVSVLESVESNDRIDNDFAIDNLGKLGEPKVQNNGSCGENDGPDKSFSEMKEKKTENSESVTSPIAAINHEGPLSSSLTKKGSGLKKWRRIKRDSNKIGASSVQTGMAKDEMLNKNENSSKRVQVSPERKQRSEGSASSTNAMVRGLDDFALLDDRGLEIQPSFASGTDLNNREDQKSRYAATESIPRLKGDASAVMGSPHEKRRMRSSSGKSLTHSMQRIVQGKGRIDTGKKYRGEKVKIEKENSHSSTESDSRSSNTAFMNGMRHTSNGMRREKLIDYNGENGDEGQGIEHQISNDPQDDICKDRAGGYKNPSTEDVGADSSWDVKDERSQNNGSSVDMDPLAEAVFPLQSVQEMLEKEVRKFSEIGKDFVTDDLVQDQSSEFMEAANGDVERETEDLFTRIIGAEVECLVLSMTVQNLKVAIDQVNILEEQKVPPSETSKLPIEIRDPLLNKVAVPEKEENELDIFCVDIASANEKLKVQTRLCKYMSCFFVQVVLLVVILVVFIDGESPNYIGVVPT